MLGKIVKTDTLYKYKLLISYFLIVATPLIIMTGLLYNISVVNIRKEIEASNKYKLAQLKNNLDLRIKELEDLALRINVDNKLTPNNMSSNEYKRLEGLYQLGMYKAQNAFIDDYYMYLKCTGNVYSASGQSTLSTLARNVYKYDKKAEQNFINEIEALKFSKFIGEEKLSLANSQNVELITYIYPVSYGNYDPYGAIIFLIKKSTIGALFKDFIGNIKGSMIILDKNNSVLLSENKSFKLASEDIDFIRTTEKNGIMDAKFGNKNVSLIIQTSENTGLKFVAAIPGAQFFQQLINVKTLILEAFLIILAFGAILAVAFSTKLYKPIGKLMNFITLQWPEPNESYNVSLDETSDLLYDSNNYSSNDSNNYSNNNYNNCLDIIRGFKWNRSMWNKSNRNKSNKNKNMSNRNKRRDEIERIGHTVETAIMQNKSLQAQINMQRPFIREQILTKLLKGEVLNEGTMKSLIVFSNIKLTGFSFAVAIVDKRIKTEERHTRVFKDKVFEVIEEKFNADGYVYPVELFQDDSIALILNLNISQDQDEDYLQFTYKIKQLLEDATEENVVIGGGKLYNNMNKINRSFIEAYAALEENKVRSRQGILMFNDIVKSQQQQFWYPLEDQLRFVQSLKQGDKAVAIEALEIMLNNVAKNQSSVLMIKYIYYDIVNMIIKTINEMKITNVDYDIEELMKFTTIEELEKETKIIVTKLCDYIKERKNTKSEELNNQILEYINKNFDDVNLSLESVADEFGFSIYYLSRFFKEQTNYTFTDYVINLKMEKARELLSTTDMPIKSIVQEIGYTDLTYFMKKFKKTEGITPGQYRELYSARKTNNCKENQ
ncbi:MAG TPA: AraC family transcriptional regulator [Clostridiales bacterium]|nr:AraC family transcriptional regulator [Clostridiales bacterium]